MLNIEIITALALAELKNGKSQYSNHITRFEKAGVSIYSARTVWLEVCGIRYMVDIYRHRLTFKGHKAPFRQEPIGKITARQHAVLSNGTIWIDIEY